ncbi:MAG: GTP-binding protein [Candidatus Tectimicrobiota bacterium]
MPGRTPLTVITGPLGSGKTTLLRHIIATVPQRLAILMNEFGEIAIDSQIITGKAIQLTELGGGCVCCSLLGEFEAAVQEILATVQPELIVVETTGVAEPDAIILDVQESLSAVRLDGVITVADADAMVQFPQLGHTSRLQLEAADLILLNKADLVTTAELEKARDRLARLNPQAVLVPTRRCQVDPALLFGLMRERPAAPLLHVHQPEVEAISYTTTAVLQRERFLAFVEELSPMVYRAKGFVQFAEGTYLFNFVAGRWDLEPFAAENTALVFIGRHLQQHRAALLHQLQTCAC